MKYSKYVFLENTVQVLPTEIFIYFLPHDFNNTILIFLNFKLKHMKMNAFGMNFLSMDIFLNGHTKL